MMEISEKVKAAYRSARTGLVDVLYWILADALRDTLARALKAEFFRYHSIGAVYDHVANDPRCVRCHDAGMGGDDELMLADDKHHNWTDSDWQAEADRLLRDTDHE